MYRVWWVNWKYERVAVPLKCCLLTAHVLVWFPSKGWTDIHLNTCSYTCNNYVGIADVNRDMCTHSQRLFISSSMSLWYSLTLAQVLPEESTSRSPPVSEARADCLTAGRPGPLSLALPCSLPSPAGCSSLLLPLLPSLHPSSWCARQISALFPAQSPLDQFGMNTSLSSKSKSKSFYLPSNLISMHTNVTEAKAAEEAMGETVHVCTWIEHANKCGPRKLKEKKKLKRKCLYMETTAFTTRTNMTMPPTLDTGKTLHLFPTFDILHPPRLGEGQPLAQIKPSSTRIWMALRENKVLFIVLLMVSAAGLVPLC